MVSVTPWLTLIPVNCHHHQDHWRYLLKYHNHHLFVILSLCVLIGFLGLEWKQIQSKILFVFVPFWNREPTLSRVVLSVSNSKSHVPATTITTIIVYKTNLKPQINLGQVSRLISNNADKNIKKTGFNLSRTPDQKVISLMVMVMVLILMTRYAMMVLVKMVMMVLISMARWWLLSATGRFCPNTISWLIPSLHLTLRWAFKYSEKD